MAAGETLILEAKDFKDPQHWRRVLKDSRGKFLADQEVSLDSGDPNYSASIDLESFLKDNSSPDRWLEDQIRLMQQLGSWIGKETLGSVAERIAKFSTPITVRVQVPPEASGLLYWPWETAFSEILVHLDLVEIHGVASRPAMTRARCPRSMNPA